MTSRDQIAVAIMLTIVLAVCVVTFWFGTGLVIMP